MIEEIVLEPQHHLLMIPELFDGPIPLRERNLRSRHLKKVDDKALPNPAQFPQRQPAWHRPFGENIVPTKHPPRQPRISDGNRFAVADVQHGFLQ